MKFNNLDDEILDFLNESLQTPEDVNADIFRINPFGNNKLPSSILYYQRKNYEKYFNNRVQSVDVDSKTFKDFIYKDALYGKIDKFNNTITVGRDSLKLLNGNTSLSLVNVAADSFNEMFLKHKRLLNTGLINTNSKFYDLNPKRAYVSPHIEYQKYLNEYFNNFFLFTKTNNLKNNIIDFSTTIKYFIYYYNTSKINYLFNKSMFVKSTRCPPNCSGLVVELSTDDHGDDKNKHQKYLEDTSFIPFQNLAKEFGFTIDRHAPWRLVFEISSPPSVHYLQKLYNINNVDNFIQENYYLADYFDYESFKVNMYNLYDFIAREQPEFKIPIFRTNKNEQICVSQKHVIRNRIQYNNITNFISEEQLLKVFFYIKCKEYNLISTSTQFEQEYNEILKIYQYKDIVSAIEVISYKCISNQNTGKENFTIAVL